MKNYMKYYPDIYFTSKHDIHDIRSRDSIYHIFPLMQSLFFPFSFYQYQYGFDSLYVSITGFKLNVLNDKCSKKKQLMLSKITF